MAVQSRRSLRNPKPVELLALAYALGVTGTLWDWREHLLGPGTQPPHLLIDLGGLLVLSVLAFSGRMDFRSRLMASLMSSMMSSRALLAYIPLVLLASWSAWHWLSQTRVNWWRLAAALGIVVVAVATVWDLYWHQTHPMEVGASMAVLPPHQAILAGFLIGLAGSGYVAVAEIRETTEIP